MKNKRGRRPKARRKEAEELEKQATEKKSEGKCKKKMNLKGKGVVTIKCSVCGQLGHNKRFHAKRGNVDGYVSNFTIFFNLIVMCYIASLFNTWSLFMMCYVA